MAEFNITQLVDTPPAGYARVDAFFTAKGDVVYAILPRWPQREIALDGVSAPSGSKITLLETGDELQWRADGSRLRITVPESLRSKMPIRDAHVFKMNGAKLV